MKTLLKWAVMIAAMFNLSSYAASWNDFYGIGGGAYGSKMFSGSGVPLAVIPSVRSNTLYYVTSDSGPGAPTVESATFKVDQLAATVDFWRATNVLTVTSNGSAGDTLIWLVASNATGGDYTTLATNDVLAYKGAGDVYQLVVLSGNATSSQGVVTSNSLMETQIKLFTGLSNAPAVGDKIYKLAKQATFTPLAFTLLTNEISFLAYGTNTITPCNQWLPLALSPRGRAISFRGAAGWPIAVTLSYSNAAGLYVEGNYQR